MRESRYARVNASRRAHVEASRLWFARMWEFRRWRDSSSERTQQPRPLGRCSENGPTSGVSEPIISIISANHILACLPLSRPRWGHIYILACIGNNSSSSELGGATMIRSRLGHGHRVGDDWRFDQAKVSASTALKQGATSCSSPVVYGVQILKTQSPLVQSMFVRRRAKAKAKAQTATAAVERYSSCTIAVKRRPFVLTMATIG